VTDQLIVMPDDTVKPILGAIGEAESTLDICMFVFNDEDFLAAIIAARLRGAQVRVMLNSARRGGLTENQQAHTALQAAGIQVRDGHPKFDVTHQKSIVIDNKKGIIQSLNWKAGGAYAARDYAIVTTRREEVEEMRRCFDADWMRDDFLVREGSRLVWCPENGRHRLTSFIDSAEHSLIVQNERYQDMAVIECLVRATMRGVKVHILTRAPHTLKPDKVLEGASGLRILHDVGAKVHTMRELKLHAKAILADDKYAIVGSINFSPGSFDSRRELAIETSCRGVVERLRVTMKHDWSKSIRIDLSELGVSHDLQRHDELIARSGAEDKAVGFLKSDNLG